MTWTSDDGQHEGWATAEFPDGRVSVGSSAAGVSVRTPEDAIDWTSGAELEVVDGRTAIGWRGICTCGWLGPLWRRVPAASGHDPARRRIWWAHPDHDPYHDPQHDLEMGAIHAEWKAHLPSPAITAVTAAAEAVHQAQAGLAAAVASARGDHHSWEAIGNAAGISKQAAHERWGP